jgi:hypothetical protein
METVRLPRDPAPWVRLAREEKSCFYDGVIFLKKGVAMKATISGLSAVLLALALTATAQAWFGFGSKCANCTPSGDAVNPGSNPANPGEPCAHADGGGHRLCKRLFHGGLFQHLREPRPLGIGSPPFARSPRDYFMLDP